MNDDALEYYIDAGKIASKVLKEATCLACDGERMSLLELAEVAESRISELGGEIAFPCNISINDIASHYTPSVNDGAYLQSGDVVKIDIGVHIEGYIADTAATVEVVTSTHKDLLLAAKSALESAIGMAKEGARTDGIGAIIEHTITQRGFTPLFDLTGHSLERYKLHGDMNIPNYQASYGHVLREGDVIAIEPFATYGKGTTVDMQAHIFGLDRLLLKDLNRQNAFLCGLYDRFKWFPFAGRWVDDQKSLQRYVDSGDIIPYPALMDVSRSIVSQFEHTVIIEKDGCRVIT